MVVSSASVIIATLGMAWSTATQPLERPNVLQDAALSYLAEGGAEDFGLAGQAPDTIVHRALRCPAWLCWSYETEKPSTGPAMA